MRAYSWFLLHAFICYLDIGFIQHFQSAPVCNAVKIVALRNVGKARWECKQSCLRFEWFNLA